MPPARLIRLLLLLALFQFTVLEYTFYRWPCSLSPAQLSELTVMLSEADKQFEKHNISYFISDGTLLGAIRSGTTIRWLDDVDISFATTLTTHAAVVAAMRENPYFVVPDDTTRRFYSRKYYNVRHSFWHGIWNKAIYIDIGFDHGPWKPYGSYTLRRRRMTLDGHSVWAPDEELSHEFLSQNFGPTYMTPQDSACDTTSCNAMTPVACRKFYPLIWPLLLFFTLLSLRIRLCTASLIAFWSGMLVWYRFKY